MNTFITIKNSWNSRGGQLEFLKIAAPLIISTGAWALQNFINRVFLAWYSQDAYAASLPAGLLNFTILSIFIGTISYIDVFISQYNGNKDYHKIGSAVWQSCYLAVIASAVVFIFSLFSDAIFNLSGHSQAVIAEEIKYFKILCMGSLPLLASNALTGFYAGREKTGVILFVNIIGIAVNAIADYVLIFGKLGFAPMGIEGAAIASILASVVMLSTFFLLIFLNKKNRIYQIKNFKPDFTFIKKLFKFGFPNGVEFFFDMGAFTFFVILMGSIQKDIQSATNIVMNINQLIFMPLVGCGITTSIMVGNYLGQNKPELASKSVRTALKIVYSYIALVVLAIVIVPGFFIFPFANGAEAEIVLKIKPLIIELLRFVAIYTVFDPLNVIFCAAIKGAGDTAFVMKTFIVLSVCVAIVPIYFVISILHLNFYIGWSIFVFYVIMLATTFFLRYKTGKWKKMRVIEMKIIES
ncbi:MATE family efflux transporter [Endomicrobium proavitum]|uniref:Multidrug-efflux transporter n=1 Tax=Endomicrobium proavitum TaxID=1408281 RepID=A0A0G3WL76_9BACT|nr:MATE family efflux transporter [Endomicrobium proavitum]AKL98254.1 MATE efflux family protein [Endomicrobium proavitum]